MSKEFFLPICFLNDKSVNYCLLLYMIQQAEKIGEFTYKVSRQKNNNSALVRNFKVARATLIKYKKVLVDYNILIQHTTCKHDIIDLSNFKCVLISEEVFLKLSSNFNEVLLRVYLKHLVTTKERKEKGDVSEYHIKIQELCKSIGYSSMCKECVIDANNWLKEQGLLYIDKKYISDDNYGHMGNFYWLYLNEEEKTIIGFENEEDKDDEHKVVRREKRKEIIFYEKLLEFLKPFNIQVIPQYKILKYRVDFYLHELNIVIEYDEKNHVGYTYERQDGRQKEIEEEIKCRFIRLNGDNSDEYNLGILIKEIFNL